MIKTISVAINHLRFDPSIMRLLIVISAVLLSLVEVNARQLPNNVFSADDSKWLQMRYADGDTFGSFENVDESEVKFNPVTDVTFSLYTKSNPTTPETLDFNDEKKLAASHFNPNNPTKFCVHGWNDDGKSSTCGKIREALITVSDYNVIVVDWSKGNNILYSISKSNIYSVGPHLGNFIKFLVSAGNARLDNVYCVGHSLGAHICGLAGKAVDGKLATIYGLDPALPLFLLASTKDRLTRGDAKYVEVVHTCGGALGFFSPIGDADFYPNGGVKQLGCGADPLGICSHSRSHQFFAESINTDVPFRAIRCSGFETVNSTSCEVVDEEANMGGINKEGLSGIYFLITHSSEPFAFG